LCAFNAFCFYELSFELVYVLLNVLRASKALLFVHSNIVVHEHLSVFLFSKTRPVKPLNTLKKVFVWIA